MIMVKGKNCLFVLITAMEGTGVKSRKGGSKKMGGVRV